MKYIATIALISDENRHIHFFLIFRKITGKTLYGREMNEDYVRWNNRHTTEKRILTFLEIMREVKEV